MVSLFKLAGFPVYEIVTAIIVFVVFIAILADIFD